MCAVILPADDAGEHPRTALHQRDHRTAALERRLLLELRLQRDRAGFLDDAPEPILPHGAEAVAQRGDQLVCIQQRGLVRQRRPSQAQREREDAQSSLFILYLSIFY